MKPKLPTMNSYTPRSCKECLSFRTLLAFPTLSKKYFYQQIENNHFRVIHQMITSQLAPSKPKTKSQTLKEISMGGRQREWLEKYLTFEGIRKIIKNVVLLRAEHQQQTTIHFYGKYYQLTMSRNKKLERLKVQKQKIKTVGKLSQIPTFKGNNQESLLPQISYPKLLKALSNEQTSLLVAENSEMQMKQLALHLGHMIHKTDKKRKNRGPKKESKRPELEKKKSRAEANQIRIQGISAIQTENPEEKNKCHEHYGLEPILAKKKRKKHAIPFRSIERPFFFSPLSLPQTPTSHRLTSPSHTVQQKTQKNFSRNSSIYASPYIKSHPISPGTSRSSRPATSTSRSHNSACSKKSRRNYFLQGSS